MIKYCEICTDHGLVGRLLYGRWYGDHKLSISTYLKYASEYLDVEIDLLIGKKRYSDLCEQRHMIMSYLLNYPRFSTISVGKAFNRDHTTVLYAKQTVYNLCFTEADYKARYMSLVDHLNKLQ